MKMISALVTLMVLLPTGMAHAFGEEKATAAGGGDSIELHIWYPSSAAQTNIVMGRQWPLIMVSHGTSGSSEDFEDTARALANSGFVVAAITHPGDNYKDKSHVRLGKHLSSRPGHVSRAIDYMLTSWHARRQIDPARVGLFGFSAGGFTALVIAGGQPDLSRTAEHCRTRADAWDCNYLRKHGAPTTNPAPIPATNWIHDARVKAAVVAAPAVGYSFEPNGLANVRIPIQLWDAQRDTLVDRSADLVRRLLPSPPEYHLVANAGHFSFMRPCDWKTNAIIHVMMLFGTENICADPNGFDRQRFHDGFNQSVVQFFSARL